MTTDDARTPAFCLLECLSGSRAYGLETPRSDTDIRGVFAQPLETLLGFEPLTQVEDDRSDTVFYELGRFIDLLIKGNPTALELLATPAQSSLQRHPVMQHLRLGDFLSLRCLATFAGYAEAQIKKAQGLNKKIHNPMPKERRGVLDFCYVLDGQGSVPVADWLAARGWQQQHCGLVAVAHTREMHGLYHSAEGLYRGIMGGPESNDISLSSVPKGSLPDAWMSFNKDGYAKHCRDWRDYWHWVEDRNDARYEATLEHGKNYDAKNMMHTFRLLDLAEDIVREGTLHVSARRRDYLLRVRSGEFSYAALVEQATAQLHEIEALYAVSDLPPQPDRAAAQRTLVEMRREIYGLA